jgi:hypothetical protein
MLATLHGFSFSHKSGGDLSSYEKFYQLARPGLLWNGNDEPPLPADGGRTRPKKRSEPAQKNSPGHDAQSNETASTEDIAAYTPSLKETRSPICEQESLW